VTALTEGEKEKKASPSGGGEKKKKEQILVPSHNAAKVRA